MIIQLYYFSSMRFMIRTALLRNITNKYNIEFTSTRKLNFSKRLQIVQLIIQPVSCLCTYASLMYQNKAREINK